MTKKYFNEKGNINYFQVLKTAVFLSVLLAFYFIVSSSIVIPWLITYHILGFLTLLIAVMMLYDTIIEVNKIFKSLIIKLHDKYIITINYQDNLRKDHPIDIILPPFSLKLLCVFRC